jgi:hypothetical protein
MLSEVLVYGYCTACYDELVEWLNELSLEDCLGRQIATATYIIDGWGCLSFDKTNLTDYLKPLLVK